MTQTDPRIERIDIPLHHPVFEGHFPGHPIMPGSLLLDLVLTAWNGPIAAVPNLKFQRPVLPGETLSLCFTPAANGLTVRFSCLRDEVPVCSGLLRLPDALSSEFDGP
ncbi:3-hydroxyacyl-ACP dehydratase FabZ family protein [Thiocystis violascens]|nr:hypothetical protein [Thiocystis violascens]